MPARKQSPPDPRPTWAYTDKGKVLACPKGLPEGSVLYCREGDTSWSRADPARAVAAPVKARVSGPQLYDEPEAN